MFSKKLSHQSKLNLRQGIKKAAVKLLGYDEKAARAVKEYFELLAARYEVQIYQIRIEIRPGATKPRVYLFLQGELTREISSEHLVHIFGGNAAKMVPGLPGKIEAKVTAYLNLWSERLKTSSESVFFRLMVLAGSPVLMAGSGEIVMEEIQISEAVTFFS